MALIKVKPTSPGRRAVVKLVSPELHKGAPYAPLVESQAKRAGRNNSGHITTRHQGGGHKQHYRMVDFRRDKDRVVAKVERLEYDPNRSAHLALLCYADGERRYIIAPKGLTVGTQLVNGPEAPIKSGNTLPLRNIPVGTIVHCVEMLPGKKHVRIQGYKIVGTKKIQLGSKPVDVPIKETTVPKAYNAESKLEVEVDGSHRTHDFALEGGNKPRGR